MTAAVMTDWQSAGFINNRIWQYRFSLESNEMPTDGSIVDITGICNGFNAVLSFEMAVCD